MNLNSSGCHLDISNDLMCLQLKSYNVEAVHGSLGEDIYNGNNPNVWAFMGLAVWSSNEPQSSAFSPTCLFSLLYFRKKKIYSL